MWKNPKYSDEEIEKVKGTVEVMENSFGSMLFAKPENPIFTNDLKKGDLVLEKSLQIGEWWVAEIMDNIKGIRRMCNVYGWDTEMGSIYSFEIYGVWINGFWYEVTHTKEQLKCKDRVVNFF